MDRNLTILLWKNLGSLLCLQRMLGKKSTIILCACVSFELEQKLFFWFWLWNISSIYYFIYLPSIQEQVFWRKKHLAILTTMKVLHSWVIMPLLNLPFIMNYTSVCSEVIMLFLQREHSPPNCRLDYYSKEQRMKKLSFI